MTKRRPEMKAQGAEGENFMNKLENLSSSVELLALKILGKGPASAATIANKTGFPRSTVKCALRRMRQMGFVRIEGRGRAARWRLTDKGVEKLRELEEYAEDIKKNDKIAKELDPLYVALTEIGRGFTRLECLVRERSRAYAGKSDKVKSHVKRFFLTHVMQELGILFFAYWFCVYYGINKILSSIADPRKKKQVLKLIKRDVNITMTILESALDMIVKALSSVDIPGARDIFLSILRRFNAEKLMPAEMSFREYLRLIGPPIIIIIGEDRVILEKLVRTGAWDRV